MKSFKILEKWAENSNRKIAISHERKDREVLKATLEKMKLEQEKIIRELHYIDYLIDLANNSNSEKVRNSPERFDDYGRFKAWLKELKKILKELNSKPKEELTKVELEILEREKGRLQGERERLEKHLKTTEELVALNKILLIDVEESYCRELSKGHSISSVAGIIKMEFGIRLEKGYSTGKRHFAKFLESVYKINHRSALELLRLLMDQKVIEYNTFVPKEEVSENSLFYSSYLDDLLDKNEFFGSKANEIYLEPKVDTWVINN